MNNKQKKKALNSADHTNLQHGDVVRLQVRLGGFAIPHSPVQIDNEAP